MQETTVAISGMTCGHCVSAVTRALSAIDGVQVKNVQVGSATVSYDAGKVSSDAIASAIKQAGYDVAGAPTTITGLTGTRCCK